MLIFTNRFLEQFSTGFGAAASGDSEASFEELVLAMFFLNDRIGGHPTTGAGAVLLFFNNKHQFRVNQSSFKP